MPVCPICNKQRAKNEMLPLINVNEVDVGTTLTGQEERKDVGDIKLRMVCRNCWKFILETKEKKDILEMLETFCASLVLLMERVAERTCREDGLDVLKSMTKHSWLWVSPQTQTTSDTNWPVSVPSAVLTRLSSVLPPSG